MSKQGRHSHGEEKGADDDTLGIRIAAIFVALAASFLGAVPPLYLKIFRDMSNPMTRMLRAGSAGIVISLGLVHALPHGIEELGTLPLHTPLRPFYNPASASAIFGILLMMVIEGLAQICFQKDAQEHRTITKDSSEHGLKKPDVELVEPHIEVHDHKPEDLCLRCHGNTEGIASCGSLKLKTLAHMFELGCIFHNVMIGIMLGVVDKDFSQARNIFIALTFHQWLEGVGLGSMIAMADFGLIKGWLLVTLYSISVPVGIAIGIGMASGYDSQSTAAASTKGTLNCVSAGILIYMGLVQIVGMDFAPESMALLRTWWAKVGCYVSFTVAVGCMSLLAIWA